MTSPRKRKQRANRWGEGYQRNNTGSFPVGKAMTDRPKGPRGTCTVSDQEPGRSVSVLTADTAL